MAELEAALGEQTLGLRARGAGEDRASPSAASSSATTRRASSTPRSAKHGSSPAPRARRPSVCSPSAASSSATTRRASSTPRSVGSGRARSRARRAGARSAPDGARAGRASALASAASSSATTRRAWRRGSSAGSGQLEAALGEQTLGLRARGAGEEPCFAERGVEEALRVVAELEAALGEARFLAGTTGPEAERLLAERGFELGHYPAELPLRHARRFRRGALVGPELGRQRPVRRDGHGFARCDADRRDRTRRSPGNRRGARPHADVLGLRGDPRSDHRAPAARAPPAGESPPPGVDVPRLRDRRRCAATGRAARHRTDGDPSLR